MANYVSSHTGAEIDSAVDKAAALPTIEGAVDGQIMTFSDGAWVPCDPREVMPVGGVSIPIGYYLTGETEITLIPSLSTISGGQRIRVIFGLHSPVKTTSNPWGVLQIKGHSTYPIDIPSGTHFDAEVHGIVAGDVVDFEFDAEKGAWIVISQLYGRSPIESGTVPVRSQGVYDAIEAVEIKTPHPVIYNETTYATVIGHVRAGYEIVLQDSPTEPADRVVYKSATVRAVFIDGQFPIIYWDIPACDDDGKLKIIRYKLAPKGWSKEEFALKVPIQTSGSWRYRLNTDGSFDAWYKATEQEVTIKSNSGNFYRSETITLTLPTAIGATEVVNATVECFHANYPVMSCLASTTGVNTITFYAVSGAAREKTANYTITAHIFGMRT